MPNRCPFKPNSFRELIKLGWNVCRNLLRPKEFWLVVNWIFWRTTYQICKRSWKNAKRCFNRICKERENYSLGSILFRILLFLKFYLKVLIQQPSKKILKNSLMPSQRFNLEKVTRKVAMKKLLYPLCNNQVVCKKLNWSLQLNVKVLLNLGWNH